MAAMTPRTNCRVCGSEKITSLFSLGEQAVSDFVTANSVDKGIKYPIDLQICENCILVQAAYTAPQDFLYTRKYWYKSGVTKTMRAALLDVVLMAERYLLGGDIALDIGSNDGTLLRRYLRGITRVGVEPASNLAEEGAEGVDIFIPDFWSAERYFQETDQRAKVITACGMFYDLEDPNQFIGDVSKVLAVNGVFIAQLMCLRQTIDLGDVGNFAHEHLEFYSLQSLKFLFERHGLEMFDVQSNDVNGGSYRLFVAHKGQHPINPSVIENISYEERFKHQTLYANFFAKLEENKRLCVEFIQREVAAGKKVWIYGASTKGNVILQYYDLRYPTILGAADRSPSKYGLYTVATGIPIFSEEDARAVNPDYFLVLPYAFLSEFVERESQWRATGGKFIIPLPEFKVI